MFQSFFTGLSGMFNFSQSLDNVSNNVANLNTPGFRGSDTFLRNVNGSDGGGYGTVLEGTATRLNSGELRQTGNETDLAINGKGFFVLQDDAGELYYTRAGQFRFNEDNVLVDSVSEYEVMGINDGGVLRSIDITDVRIRPAVATTEISLSGNLSSTDTDHQIEGVSVFDALGEAQVLTLDFTNPAASTNTWDVAVTDSNGNSLGTGQVQFDAAGSPLNGENSFDITTNFSGQEQTIAFNFGDPGSFSGATQFSGGNNSTLGVNDINGNGVLGVTQIAFNSEGVLEITYSNGDTEEGQQVALASFASESELNLSSGSIYTTTNRLPAEFGRADSLGLGRVEGGRIELSNVDLTQEFADILIVQRGYQASSRIMSVSNEMLEQLYDSTRG